jgi:tocopherol O-methyltransferase
MVLDNSSATADGLPDCAVAHAQTPAWYDSKTAALMEKYGGFGPRVHYHVGFVRSLPSTLNEVRQEMFRSQEESIEWLFGRWNSIRPLQGVRALDVGCGLGGSMLWLAEHYRAAVTGLTVAQSHVPVITQLAQAAQLQDRVQVVVEDAANYVSSTPAYDYVYCIEAAMLFERDKWFANVAKMLRPDGVFAVDEYFCEDPTLAAWFDRTYASRCGNRAEYDTLAAAHGFTLVDEVDLTSRSPDFWELCARYSELTEGQQAGWHQSPAFQQRALLFARS